MYTVFHRTKSSKCLLLLIEKLSDLNLTNEYFNSGFDTKNKQRPFPQGNNTREDMKKKRCLLQFTVFVYFLSFSSFPLERCLHTFPGPRASAKHKKSLKENSGGSKTQATHFAVVENENSNEKEKKEMQIVKGENTCFEYLLCTLYG